MTFQIQALPADQFAPLFALDDAALASRNAQRVTADTTPGYPCRVSLADVAPGTELILLNHTHLDVASPYASRHAIFVAKDAVQAIVAPGNVPDALHQRMLSVRGFDGNSHMIEAKVAAGDTLADLLTQYFSNPDIAWVDIHSAARGCFLARARRSV